MTSCCGFLRSSIGKKFVMAFTGLMLAGFTLQHMAANMLLIFNQAKYNEYSHALTSNKALLYGGEAFLIVVFVIHIALAIQLSMQNRAAKSVTPGPKPKHEKEARFASRSMLYTGLLLLVFVVFHLKNFKYGTYYSTSHGGVEMRDLGRLVNEKFQEPLEVGIYIGALAILLLHLSHGLTGLLQSVGLSTVKNRSAVTAGWVFAVLIACGFMTQPIYIFLMGGNH